jgi:hypothetical protein
VDGNAIREGSQTIPLSPGKHLVGVYNYGYTPHTENVDITAGNTTALEVTLNKFGDKVSGPFAEIEFKGDPRAAVLLNGTTPDYFVGHVDEFDWDWIWHQRLLVKPGTYQVTVTREGRTIWAGPVTANAGQHVTVYLDQNGRTKTQSWNAGNTMGPQPRFHAGIASATVPIAPVTAQFAAQPGDVNCGQSTDLHWKTADAVDTSITNIGKVSNDGDQSVLPTKTTAYALTAKGPGGVVTQMVTVNVNSQPTASLTLSQPEVRFHKIGDKVVKDDTTMLNWTTSNANSVNITPLGSESMSGSRTIAPMPKQTVTGQVNEVEGYTLVATNACGGTARQTATLHITGSIDPAPPVTLASIFYPTDFPRAKHPKIGLVASERQLLSDAANRFKSHAQYDHAASLMIVAHADVRGSKKYNMSLSERRANVVKNYLVSQGVPADKIQTHAEGKEQELSEKEVAKLQSEDAQKPEKWMMHHTRATWLAYNRRADIILEPTGQQSTEAYPNDASDARLLWQQREPSLKSVEVAAKSTSLTQEARAAGSGN